MSNVFEQIEQERQEQRKVLLAEYYALLAAMELHTPTATEKARLGELMERLNKSATAVKADHAEIAAIQQHIVNSADKDAKNKAVEEADKVHLATCAESQQLWKNMQIRVNAARGVYEDALNALHICSHANGELIRLKERNPALYEAIVVKSPTNPAKKRK